MAEALVSVLLEQLVSITTQQTEQKIRLVVDVKNNVKKIESELKTIKAVLNDAEERQVMKKAVKVWLDKLKDASYDMDDVLDEWNTALIKSKIEKEEKNASLRKKVRTLISSSCFCFGGVHGIVHRHDIARKIKSIVERLNDIAEEKNKYNFKEIQAPKRQHTTSFIDVSEVYGRDNDKESIVNRVLCESTQGRGLHVISVSGFGGLGKTTLAQLAYNDSRVIDHFKKRIWVCVSDPFDTFRVAKAINESLTGTKQNLDELENVLQHLRMSIEGKKFLLVLDDVWTENYKDWEPLKHCLNNGDPGSKILVTTRKEGVSTMMAATHTIHLGRLSDDNSWSLFSELAFHGRSDEECENLEELGRKIVDKCKGLPLAIKTLGSHLLLKKKKDQWQNVLDSRLWELEDVEKCIFVPLLFSYYDLPSAAKRCFSYCAVLPKGKELNVDMLIQMWMAQGYLNANGSMEIEMIGQHCFENLVMRCFFQDFVKSKNDGRIISCRMHDIVHDVSQMVASETKELGIDSSSKNIRHSTSAVATQASFPKNLRTLLVLPGQFISMDAVGLPNLLCHLACLRALDLSRNSLTEVPREVGKLIHLRYLNLGYNYELKKLPEAICDLCNLQTLILNSCLHLEKLPQGMEKLIYLRHLDIIGTASLSFLPKGIGSLTSLRTLNHFFGSKSISWQSDGGKACNLGDLENLNQLEGYLSIDGLGNVENVTEAEKARLKEKEGLVALDLRFSDVEVAKSEKAEGRMDDALKLIEALQPPSKLQYLWIDCYKGSFFPNWLMVSTNVTNLRELKLFNCSNCEYLPPLGKLQSLESLEIKGMVKVIKVSLEFLGIKMDDGDGGTAVSFPKLENLSFYYMENLENWGEIPMEVVVMPYLRSLTIVGCPKLKTLPRDYFQSTKLQDLVIEESPIEEDWIKSYLASHKSMASPSCEGWPNEEDLKESPIEEDWIKSDLASHESMVSPSCEGRPSEEDLDKKESPIEEDWTKSYRASQISKSMASKAIRRVASF